MDVTFPVNFIHSQTLAEYIVNRNFYEFMSHIVAYSRDLPTSPLSSFSPYVSNMYILLTNMVNPRALAQSEALDLALEHDTVNTIDVLRYIIIALVVLPILSLFLVIVLVLRPTVFEIEENKSQVILVFLDIPTNIVIQLKQIYTSRIQSFQQSSVDDGGMGLNDDMGFLMYDEHDEYEEPDNGGENKYKNTQVVPLGGGDQASVYAGSTMGPGAGSVVGYDTMTTYTATTHAAGNNAGAQEGNGQQHQQENITFSSDKYVFLLKICLLFLLAILYFLLVFFTGIYAIEPHLKNAPVLIRVNSMRATALTLATHFTTILATFSSAGALLPSHWPQPNVVRDYWKKARTYEDALMNGNSELGVTGYNQGSYYRTKKESGVVFGNACGFLDAYMSPIEPYCVYFRDGIMLKGVHEVTLDAINVGESTLELVIDEIQTTYAANNTEGFTPATGVPENHVYADPVYLSDAFVATQADGMSDLMMVCDWVSSYILSAYTAHSGMFIDAVRVHVDEVMVVQLIMFVIFATLSVMVYIFVYVPLIHLLDTQIKRTRSMLLMIPADVLESIPAARLMLQNKQTVL